MPFKSDKQRRAMYAAAKGRSTAGIPKKVAKKFIAHKADGGRLEPTGSAGRAAPTIATSARYYANGGAMRTTRSRYVKGDSKPSDSSVRTKFVKRSKAPTRKVAARRVAAAPSTPKLKTLPATKPPKTPVKVTVTKRRPTSGKAPGSQGRKTAPATAKSTGPSKRRGPARKTRTRSSGLKGLFDKLTSVNKAAVKRARAHGNRD